MVNGLRSVDFRLSRGTRQGCPLSPILFALSLEPLAEAIRSSSTITGVEVANSHQIISLFADDTVIYITDPINSLNHLMPLIEEFGAVSGFAINWSKTELYPVHISLSTRVAIQTRYNFKWVTSTWRHLGVLIPLDLSHLYTVNYTPLINKVRRVLRHWSSKWLTWTERIELVKSVILPQFLFLFQSIPIDIPPKFISKWQRDITKFVWAAKPHRVAKTQLSKPTKMGGYGLPLLQAYYDASQLSVIFAYLHDFSMKSWISIEESVFKPYRLRDILWNLPRDRPKMAYNNPFLSVSLKVWDKL